MPLAGKLEEELQRFSLKTVTLNSNNPEAWRENENDDLVFALALATWQAKEYLPKPPAVREREQRKIDASNKEMDAYLSCRPASGLRRGKTRADGAVLRGFYR